ncbi:MULTISPECIES: glycosyltransferase family 2 protein [Arthrobacter]|uniref:Glycosyltransferase family 2 protein n=2 Tax=Arthrobacter TaxID=1663 RepID=A0ABU9KKD3_9MICC|nr:glycosyltransferase family 2 protein [Arthrobacter sp. YJM1]MDP5227364.1 glycosyltransferase family 2 protein [Arthrobacter sp. YJM1]
MVVSHHGSPYLPRTLAALSRQSRPADLCIGVDAASSDGSGRLLEEALGNENVTLFRHPRLGFGRAVHAGLALADRVRTGLAAADGQEWVWLLHDDAAPAPDALERLLEAVERSSNVTIAGCKQLDWDAPRKLVDAGLAVSTWAERLTLIEADELDQGQYDQLRDRFAVNSAGMLVRRDVWDAFEGFDPALPGTGDDVDLCWRNWLAGNNVAFVPEARMFHVRNRPHALGTPAAARSSQVYLRLKHASGWKIPFLVLGTLLASVGRFLMAVAMKDPGYGFQQLSGAVRGVSHPVALARSRKVAARTRRNPRGSVKRLQTPRAEVWAHRRSLMETLGADELLDAPYSSTGLAAEPSGDSQDDFSALAAPGRAFAGWGLIAAVVITAAIALVGLFPVLGGPQAGGALLPLSDRLGEVWDNAGRTWITLQAGYSGHGDPFGYVLWLLAVLNGGQTASVVQSTLLAAMPLAAAGAWFLAAAVSRRRRTWFLAALLWGTAPVLFVGLNQGRLGAVLVHVIAPWAFLALIRATGSARDRRAEAVEAGLALPQGPLPGKAGVGGTVSWTAAAWAGLLLAALTASAPALLLPSLILVLVFALLLGRRGRTLWWTLVPPVALFLPFAVAALTRPVALLGDPGLPLGFQAAPLWQQLLGQPLAFPAQAAVPGFGWLPAGVPWALVLAIVIAAPVLLLAVWGALVPGRRGRVSMLALFAAAVFLAAGWALAGIPAAADGDVVVPAFSGPAVSVAFCALLLAAVAGADRALQRRRAAEHRRAPWRMALVSVVTLVVLLGPAIGSWSWLTGNLGIGPAAKGDQYGAARLIHTDTAPRIPATAVDRGRGPEQTRTLVVTELNGGGYAGALVRGSGTTLDSLSAIAGAQTIRPGTGALAADDDATASLRTAVATIVAGQGVDPRPQLEKLGAGFVVFKGNDDAAQLTASRIDAVPGLAAVGPTDAGWLWRVRDMDQPPLKDSDTVNRVRVLTAAGAVERQLPGGPVGVDTQLAPGAAGRKLVLAERSDPEWSATLDGKTLTPGTVGWQQSFELPAAGGHLVVTHGNAWTPALQLVPLVVFLLTALLAVPIPERPGKVRMVRDEASLRKAGR